MSVSRFHFSRRAAAFAWAAAWAGMALAVPVQSWETNLAINLPRNFVEVNNRDAPDSGARFFVQQGSGATQPVTWLTLRALPTGSADQATGDPQEVLGRYTEPWHNLDISVLCTRDGTDILQRTARLPMRAQSLEVTLKSRTLTDREMAALMQKVLASVQQRQAAEARNGMPGWARALLYLALAAIVVVVAFAKGSLRTGLR